MYPCNPFTPFIFLNVIFPLCLLVMISCGTDSNHDNGQSFMELYGGDPYTGTINVNIQPPDELREFRSGEGASAHFTENENNQATFVVHGIMEEDSGENGDAGFVSNGVYTNMEWESEPGNVTLKIDKNGHISGGGTLHPQHFQFEGTLTEGHLELKVEIEVLEETGGGYPAGTRFEFNYKLYRSVDGTSNESCSDIRYEMRPVANIGAGTIDMIQVPICLD